jgi:hypothetical protein
VLGETEAVGNGDELAELGAILRDSIGDRGAGGGDGGGGGREAEGWDGGSFLGGKSHDAGDRGEVAGGRSGEGNYETTVGGEGDRD